MLWPQDCIFLLLTMNLKLLKLPTICSIILFILSFRTIIFAILQLLCNKTIIVWWEINIIFSSQITFPIIFDPLGLTFSSVVLFISANVLIFSNTYIEGDQYLNRFILLVCAFILSINILIFFPHLFTLLLGWDGLGLISFILVIYYQNRKSLGGGLLTALTNRIGDAFLIISIALMLNQNHWIITHIWEGQPIGLRLFLMLAAITKSAQTPFSRWLPAAIAAPTPVSALVHSSTLVTAGVFLLIRFYPILHLTCWFGPTLLVIACFTIIIAGIRAIAECDLKKIIALSTLRQLGLIITSLGLGYVMLTLFHLITHALFKALLFLCAGNIIHVNLHNQDLRTVGNLAKQIPVSSSCFLVANLALCGAPFIAGFYSKDTILELSIWFPLNIIIFLIIFSATRLTAIYSARFFIYLLVSPNFFYPLININEEDNKRTGPISVLTIGAIFGGSIIFWIFFPFNQTPVLPLQIKLFTIAIIILSIFVVVLNSLITNTHKTISLTRKSIFTAHSYIWFLSPITTQGLIKHPIKLGHNFLKILDHSWVELIVSQSRHLISSTSSKSIQSIHKTPINTFLLLRLISAPLYTIFLI